MKSLLKRLFINHWQRKCLSVVLAIAIWFLVNKSLTTTKTILNVPVKVENIPPGKTVEGIQSNGLLSQRVNLTLMGSKQVLSDLSANDLMVVFDASGQEGEWIASIGKKNLRSDSPDFVLPQGISKVGHQNFIIKLTKLVTEKIPIIITKPIGEGPKGYQFIDIWPYQLYITVSGPEDLVKNLKGRGIKWTFNLNDISKGQLDEIGASTNAKKSDVVSFFVPNEWKQLSLPLLSSTPIEINDPDAKYLRIDFLRYELLKLNSFVPVSLYYPPSVSGVINPSKISLATSGLVESKNGIKMITDPLYVKGVSALFLDVVKDMVEISVIMRQSDDNCMDWSIQFIDAQNLEDRYIRFLTSDVSDDELRELQPQLREDYLRYRFRSYMSRFQFYKSANEPLKLCPTLQGNTLTVDEKTSDEKK